MRWYLGAGKLGPAARPPSFEHLTPVRRGAAQLDPPVGILSPAVRHPTLDQHGHGGQPPIGLEPAIHARAPILQIPAVRRFPTIQGWHVAKVPRPAGTRQTPGLQAPIFLRDNG